MYFYDSNSNVRQVEGFDSKGGVQQPSHPSQPSSPSSPSSSSQPKVVPPVGPVRPPPPSVKSGSWWDNNKHWAIPVLVVVGVLVAGGIIWGLMKKPSSGKGMGFADDTSTTSSVSPQAVDRKSLSFKFY